MNHSSESDWKPDPEMLAAYFDGELEGRDDAAELRARIEAWIEANPQAADHWDEHLQLKKLWIDTTPAEPSAEAWVRIRNGVDAERKRPTSAGASRRTWLTASVVAASVLLFVGILGVTVRSFLISPKPQPVPIAEAPDDVEMLEVALSSEVTIFRIDTDDIESVIVGEIPVTKPLDMVVAGEACISCQCPRIVVRQDPPMVWGVAKAD